MDNQCISKEKYLKLFLSVFKISAFTFGGGFVIIPLMRKKFVEELKWIGEDEMLDLVSIAQSSPGAIAVNASILVGYHVAGLIGAFVAIIGTIIPPLTIISVISLFYKAFRDNIFVSMAMSGMICGVAAVIIDVVINMAKKIFIEKRILPIIVLFAAFISTRYLKINIILIIITCAFIGAIDTLRKSNKERKVE